MARAFILVLDSLGIGATPDAGLFGDAGADTFGHIAAWRAAQGRPLRVPQLESLGLGAAAHAAGGRWPAGLALRGGFRGRHGAARERSAGKDTPSGHWEIAGVPVEEDWGMFPRTEPCFPAALTDALIERAGLPGLLGNCHASGTEIIARLGDDHVASGKPIAYTSGDSVFQLAAHEDSFGLERLHALCEIAFELVRPWRVARVIARPFTGASGRYRRTSNRRDYAVPPPAPTLLDSACASGRDVIGIGKTGDIFAQRGLTASRKGEDNTALFDALLDTVHAASDGALVVANFVDFDQSFGHRRDVAGYADALEAFDARLPAFIAAMRQGDLAVVTADHGCDPTAPGSDHTREHVPMLFFGPGVAPCALGISDSFADIGQTLAAHLGLPPLHHGKNLA